MGNARENISLSLSAGAHEDGHYNESFTNVFLAGSL